MVGYAARQETYTTGDTIQDTDSNNEFNAILSAFDVTTGHNHDGAAGEGSRVLITDTTGGTQYGMIVLNGTGSQASSTAALTTGQLMLGQSAAVPSPKTMSGDATIIASGALTLASTAVTPASYGSATVSPTFTVDAKGRLTAAADVVITPAFASLTSTPTTLSGYGITDAQGLDTTLTSIAALGTAADKYLYTTGIDTWAEGSITAAGRAILDDASASAQRTTLGLNIGTDVQAYDATILVDADIGGSVQAYDADLTTIAGLAKTNSNFIVGNGSTWVVETSATARTSLGLTIGTDVQAYDVDTLKADVADVLTAGFAATPNNAGTKSSGTFTPDEANSNFQYAVNGGAHTLAPPTNNSALIIQYTNNASAGTITTSGFTLVDGDTITTTNGDDFFFYITKNNGFSLLTVRALQ